MRFLRRSLTGLFMLALTLGLLAFAFGNVQTAIVAQMNEEPGSRPARERIFAVNTVTLTPGVVEPVLEVFGEVQSRRALDIRSEVSGTVVELAPAFVEGGRITAGDLLMRIDPANAEAAVALAEIDLRDAESEVADARNALALSRDDLIAAQEQAALRERALNRQRDLVDRGVGTEANLESAELSASSARQAVLSRQQAIQSAEARLNTALIRRDRVQINLDEARRDLTNTEIYAAFTGTLSDVSIVEGGIVSTNERVAQLIDPSALEVAVRVSTSQYNRLTESGQLLESPAQVTLDVFGLDLTIDGTVSRESASVGEGQTGRQLFVSLSDASGLRPGDFVRVGIREPAVRGVATIPSAALSASNKVLVIGEDERLSEADVTLVRRQGEDVLVRARGLAGQQIVAERSPLLGAGIKVRPLSPAEGTEVAAAPAMIALDDQRRTRLIAFVEGNSRMPAAAKERVLSQLQQPEVPVAMVERIEGRMGG